MMSRDMNGPPFDEREYSPGDSLLLAQWSPGGFRDESETLYRTPKGNFFILSRYGFLSRLRYAPGEGDWFGGQSIRPVSPREALAWCEETGSYEAMEEIVPYLAAFD